MVVACDRHPVPAPHEPVGELEHEPDAAPAAGLATDVVVDERDVHPDQ
jgi:hypothetical protein